MEVVTLGVSENQVDALEAAGHSVREAEGIGEEMLQDAGVGDAEVFVAAGRRYAVQVPVAKDVNPALRTVLVADDAPDYVRGSVDVILGRGMMDHVVEAVEGLGEGLGNGDTDDGSSG